MYGKKVRKQLSLALFIGFCLALVSCQRGGGIDEVRQDFQTKAETKLQRLSTLYSSAFAPPGARGARGAINYVFPNGQTYTQGSYSYNYAGQSYAFDPRPLQAIQQVEAILAQIPRTRSTYYFCMVLIARYLTMALHDSNFLMTWMSQQYGQYGLGYAGYNLAYPSFTPYQQPTQFPQANQFALQGYAEGQ